MKRTYIRSLLVFVFASLFLTFSFVSTPAKAAAAATEAPSTHKAVLTTNRAAGTANYTVTGLDLASDTALTINAVNSSTKKTAFTKKITLDETNCKEGTFTGNITLADLKYAFANYTVTVTIGTKTLTAGTADFTIHTAKAGLSITGNTGAAVRTACLRIKRSHRRCFSSRYRKPDFHPDLEQKPRRIHCSNRGQSNGIECEPELVC